MSVNKEADRGIPELAGVENKVGGVIGDSCTCVDSSNGVFVRSLVPDNFDDVADLDLRQIVKRVELSEAG